MRYKVYDTIKKKFITNDSGLILKPNGRLAFNDYGDEVGVPHCITLFFPTDSDDYYCTCRSSVLRRSTILIRSFFAA